MTTYESETMIQDAVRRRYGDKVLEAAALSLLSEQTHTELLEHPAPEITWSMRAGGDWCLRVKAWAPQVHVPDPVELAAAEQAEADRPGPAGDWVRLVARDMFGRRTAPSVVVDPECWARGPWTAVAATLAEPLRKALHEHLDAHGCAERGGFANCPDARRLWDLLPAGDRVAVAGPVPS